MNEPSWETDYVASGGMGNAMLYRMVKEHIGHRDHEITRDKIWIIGRAYSASIARGAGAKGQDVKDVEGGLFGLVARQMANQCEKIDGLIEACRGLERVSPENVDLAVETHGFLDTLIVKCIHEWQGRSYGQDGNRRVSSRGSFSSKYLHFHAPMAFFILDSIVERRVGMYAKRNQFSDDQRRFIAKLKGRYGKHCGRMLACAENLYAHTAWTPRLIDSHFMKYNQATPPPAEIAEIVDEDS